jgi:hypothetical protein
MPLCGGFNTGLAHFGVEVVTFTCALTHAGEDGVSAMAFGNVIDEFHDDDGLSDAGTTEGADFSALGEGTNKIDDLDACFEDLGLGVLIYKSRGLAVNGVPFLVWHGTASVCGIAGHVENAAQNAFANGNGNRSSERGDFHAAAEAFGRAHGNGPNPIFTEVLLDFEGETGLFSAGLEIHLESVIDFWESSTSVEEFDVHNGSDNLYDSAFRIHV